MQELATKLKTISQQLPMKLGLEIMISLWKKTLKMSKVRSQFQISNLTKVKRGMREVISSLETIWHKKTGWSQ